MSRKRPKSLETNVYRKLWQLEHWAYTRVDAWKKSYRYSLINEFRGHITFAKNAYIAGFELLGRFKDDKVNYFRASMGELSIVESNMDHMISDDIGIMSKKEWAQAAALIDSIRVELTKLINSLNAKGAGGSESSNFGTESVSAGYKDAILESQ